MGKTTATVALRTTAPQDPAAEWVETSKLRPWADNPRVNEHAVPDVARSIERFGFGAPLLARRENGEIIAGHTRLKAALKLGLSHVPVRYLELDERQAHQLALADNRLSEKADWSLPDLYALLSSLEPLEAEIAGWSSEDIAKMQAELEPPFEPGDAEDQGNLDQLAPKLVTCPSCGHEWDLRDTPVEKDDGEG